LSLFYTSAHIVTFDGLSYDVHVKGELTFLKSLDPENDFTIQARTVAVKNHPKGPAVTTGVVVHEDGRVRHEGLIAGGFRVLANNF
jgi:hypothetical protein